MCRRKKSPLEGGLTLLPAWLPLVKGLIAGPPCPVGRLVRASDPSLDVMVILNAIMSGVNQNTHDSSKLPQQIAGVVWSTNDIRYSDALVLTPLLKSSRYPLSTNKLSNL